MRTEGAAETLMIEPNSRDHELLRMLAQGCSYKEIASFLNVSPPTVKKQLQTLFLELLVAKETTSVALLTHRTEKPQPAATGAARETKAILYGLPCSHCHAYYCAEMHVCPVCKSPDRVSPNAVPVLPVVPAIATPNSVVPMS
jgi:hypothetical protein